METLIGRAIPVEGIVNFRDLGGYPAADDRRVRSGLIFRSGGPVALNFPKNLALLQTLGIKTVLDFRSAGEQAQMPDRIPEGVDYIRVSAMYQTDGSELDFSPSAITKMRNRHPIRQEDKLKSLVDMYRQMPFGNPAYQALFQLLEGQRTPLLFHCSAGRDRTGVAAMLVLLALGVKAEIAVEDYMKSELYLGPDMVFRDAAEAVPISIKERYGSCDAYFEKEYGLSAKKMEVFRGNFLESAINLEEK